MLPVYIGSVKDLVSQKYTHERVLKYHQCQFQEHQISKGQLSDRYFRDINTLVPLLFTTKFSSARRFKNHIELFSTTLDCESHLILMYNLKKKTDKTHLIQFQLFIFCKSACSHENFTKTTIHPGIFRGRALWADSVFPLTNTIASHDLFKP